ncbi:hypothetical protein [Aestuariivirga sp.]
MVAHRFAFPPSSLGASIDVMPEFPEVVAHIGDQIEIAVAVRV